MMDYKNGIMIALTLISCDAFSADTGKRLYDTKSVHERIDRLANRLSDSEIYIFRRLNDAFRIRSIADVAAYIKIDNDRANKIAPDVRNLCNELEPKLSAQNNKTTDITERLHTAFGAIQAIEEKIDDIWMKLEEIDKKNQSKINIKQ